MLGTLDRIPRKFGISKEATRDRRLLPEGYEATTNGWKAPRVAPRARTVHEVPGITDRRLSGVIKAFREIGGEMAYGFIQCPEVMKFCGRDIFVRSSHVQSFKVGDPVSFRIIFKEKRRPEAVELSKPSDATVGKEFHISERELLQKGYVVRTLSDPADKPCSPQSGDTVCVSYTARLAADGTVIDAAENFRFTLGAGSVIPGLDRGIVEMSIGQEARLIVHHTCAYGETGAPGSKPIPPFADLDYAVTLRGVEGPSAQAAGQGRDGEFYAASIEALEQYLNDVSIVLTGGAGEEVDAADRSDGQPVAAGRSTQRSRGPHWRSLMGAAMSHSVKSWLLAIDKQGTLLGYHDRLQQEYDSVHDIVSVYTRVNPDGSTTIEPEFFDDMGVAKTASRRLFQKWFECPGEVV